MSIDYCEKCRAFFLDGKDFSYVMRVDSEGRLCHMYYGAKLPHTDLSYYKPDWVGSCNGTVIGGKKKYSDMLCEYSAGFLGDYREPALITRDARGCRVCDLRYESFEILEEKPAIASGIPTARGGKTLVITLKDSVSRVSALLYYTVYENENILTRRTDVINGSGEAIHLERALSAAVDFYDSDFRLLTLWGHHAKEKHPDVTELIHGRISVGSVRGSTSHHHANFAALMRPGTDEEQGEVYAVSLMYSGSHMESVEVNEGGSTRLSVGINPESFCWKLENGDKFETPEAVLNYSPAGLGQMSRQFHDFFRQNVICPRWVNRRRPVVLNSWEGMHFRFDRDRLCTTIDKLKDTGIELFVLDDGWFGARNNDRAGLGDWFVNEEKLPGGLQVIADRCHANGLKFGLWIEPEMVNPDSDLYRAHPDWIIGAPDREPITSRNQCILDFSNPDVVEYIKQLMVKVISESGADYIKWDMNRNMSEDWSYWLPADRQGEVQHRYILGVYELARYLTEEKFPDILFEGCAGGGGRFDGAMLRYFPQIWSSDNTDADDRTRIQYGTTLVFPLSCSSNHVSISPNIRNGRAVSLDTRTNIAYGGTFGYEFDVEKMPENELKHIPGDVEKYHTVDALIREGDLYRGANRNESNEMLTAVVSKDKKHAFVTYYLAMNPHKMCPRVRIPGLDDGKLYHINELDLTLYGAVLRRLGIILPKFKHDFASVTLTLDEVTE